jgi:hypothetical protein
MAFAPNSVPCGLFTLQLHAAQIQNSNNDHDHEK